jgi:hypothetical protein
MARLARDVQAAVDIAHRKHLIPQNDLLPIPRPGRHSHFSVRLALDYDRRLVAGREFFENFFGRVTGIFPSGWRSMTMVALVRGRYTPATRSPTAAVGRGDG